VHLLSGDSHNLRGSLRTGIRYQFTHRILTHRVQVESRLLDAFCEEECLRSQRTTSFDESGSDRQFLSFRKVRSLYFVTFFRVMICAGLAVASPSPTGSAFAEGKVDEQDLLAANAGFYSALNAR